MKISAVVSEYNPFHFGHALHLAQTRKAGGDKIIVIMSGNFTQRGEAAVFDKFARAAAALTCGADLVLELPTFFALSPAQGFANGAVRILNALCCVNQLSFGCETADMQALRKAASLLTEEPPQYRRALQSRLSKGQSFPAARAQAVKEVFGQEAAAPLFSPNSILALEYLQALERSHSAIEPYAVLREGSSYLSPSLTGPFSSALSIRREIENGGTAWRACVPGQTLEYDKAPLAPSALFAPLMYILRSSSPKSLSQFLGMEEGLEYKIWRVGQHARSYEELLSCIKSKRYPMARIKRALCTLLLGITKQKARELDDAPLYARVLGVRKESKELLSLLCRTSRIPVLCSPKDLASANPLLALDLWATDLYSALQAPAAPAGRDYTRGLICL